MGKGAFQTIKVIAAAAAIGGFVIGCSSTQGKDVRSETVAQANGDEIRIREVREFLGSPGGFISLSDVPADKKKEAVDRLIAGRLLAQDARGKGLDNTEEFRNLAKQNEPNVLISALFRKETDSALKIDSREVKEEAKKLREANKNLSEKDADGQANRLITERKLRKLQEDLIAAAKKDTVTSIDEGMVEKIAKGEKVGDDAVLGTAGGEKIDFGTVKRMLQGVAGATHGGEDLSRNPTAIARVLDRETTGRALAAYARKQGVEKTEWMKSVRQDLERGILANLLAEKLVPQDISVPEKEIEGAYAEHEKMFVREGKKVPLARVRDQIRAFLENGKRTKALEAHIAELRTKAKISVNEAALSKI